MLIPTITFSALKKMKAPDVEGMKSVAVTSNSEVLFFAIIPPQGAGMTITDNIKTQAEYLAARGNTVGGKDPAELQMVEV